MNRKIKDIWTDLHQELKRFILGKVKDHQLSNDILQDVFLKIHLNIHTLTNCNMLTSWVYQITRNTIADHYRKQKKTELIENVDFAEQAYEEPLYASLSNCINQKIDLLPEKYKQAILLNAFENYSQIALANEWGISYSGAKTRIQRAREELKDLIGKCKNVEINNKGIPVDYQPNEK